MKKINRIKFVFYSSSMDFFWKKECTGCTRLMRKGIQAEKNEKDDAGYFLKVSKQILSIFVVAIHVRRSS